LKGVTDFEEDGILETGVAYLYNQEWLRRGFYGRNAYFVQQDSVFWKADLWKRTGGVKRGLRFAGDYYLWLQFAKFTPLYTLNKEISCFRTRPGQLSEDMKKYREEQASISRESGALNFIVKVFFWTSGKFSGKRAVSLFAFLYRLFFPGRQKVYFEPGKKNDPTVAFANYYLPL